MSSAGIPAQLTAAQRARIDEEGALAAIEDQRALIARGQSMVPPEPEIPVFVPTPDAARDEAATEALAGGPDIAALRASGMTDAEIEQFVAEMNGLPVPELPPAARVMEQVEGLGAVGPAFATPAVRQAPQPPRYDVVPRVMTPDDMAEATRAVNAAKNRLSDAEESLKQAQAERAAAVEALEAARRTVAEGVAALML